jgi:hypothetical protein
MDDEVVYRHFVGYLKAKIADAELNKEDSFELTKVGNEDDYFVVVLKRLKKF